MTDQEQKAFEQMREALDTIIEFNRDYAHYQYGSAEKAERLACIVKAREAITAADAVSKNSTVWISVEDQMPPPQVRVLGFEPRHSIVDVDMWFGPDFYWGYSYWMPLPPAPKE